MSDFHIDEAFCLEMGRNVTILEANDYYFSQPSKRNRLNFECPDEACREELHPKIIGVNYDKDIYIISMHFRRNPNYKHRDDCSIGIYEKLLQEMLRNKKHYKKDSSRNLFLELPDSEKIPDVFQPHREVDAVRKKSAASQRQAAITSTQQQSKISFEERIRRAQYKTRSMQVVVEAFERLEIDQRDIPSLTIEGRTMRYGTAFKHIRYMEEWHTWPHIYYGSARIYRYKDGFRAFFDEKVREFLPGKLHLDASIFFPLENGEVPDAHPYDALKRAAQSKEHCCIYMFASKNLVNDPLGSSKDSKEWIKLETQPGETVITFNMRPCK